MYTSRTDRERHKESEMLLSFDYNKRWGGMTEASACGVGLVMESDERAGRVNG
jgi:hypothetical protein